MKKILLITFVTFIFSFQVSGKTVNAGSGGPTGNYFGMMNDIKNYCQEEIDDSLNVINTGGSLDNLTGMTNKKYSLAPVQEDVLQFLAKQMPRKVNGNRQKIIAGLHLETAHLMIPFGYEPESSGFSFSGLFNSGDKKPLSLDALKNQKVASSGGSIVSLKALSYFLDLRLKIVELKIGDLAKSGLPVFLVGGQPYKPVENILSTNKYALISIDFDRLKSKAPFYLPMQANYKVKGKINTTKTFAVRALLVGKSFRKKSKNETMSKLATCISQNLADFADDDETNPNWETVYELEENEGSQSGWPYFNLIEQ
jgi:TRAP-type uncharacterized transport system substrate-binding protein